VRGNEKPPPKTCSKLPERVLLFVSYAERRPPLWHKFLSDARFHEALLALDVVVAQEARGKGCPACGGTLHSAAYWRKPRGGPDLPAEHSLRLSFCCATDGCRRRMTPASLRFLGRRVYVATVVVLACVLRHGPTPTRMGRLRELVGVGRRTVERWCSWWRDRFCETAFWRIASAQFVPPIAVGELPVSLLDRFVGDPGGRLLAALRFLGPITRGTNDQPR
jgi:hypothetical protein